MFTYYIIVIIISNNHILFGTVSRKNKKSTQNFSYIKNPNLDWSPGMNVPFDIRLMYFVQCGFYLHSVYGTLYMDYKRKDFFAMLLHHVLTMVLIFVSYATR